MGRQSVQEVLCAPFPLSKKPSQNMSAHRDLLSLLHPFVHGIVHPFIPQVPGAPCSHTVSFSGVSWLKPERGEELPMVGSYSTGPSWGWGRSGDPHPTHPTSSAKSCLAQHFLPSFLVAGVQGLLSVPGPYKGPFDEKFEAK